MSAPAPRILPHYRVEVDRATGDWLTTPEYLGHHVHLGPHRQLEGLTTMLTPTALANDLTACMKHLNDVLEYAERYADLASEPAGGNCMIAVQRANAFLDRRLRPVPASVAASAAAIIGQPDLRRWRVHGVLFSTAEIVLANAHAPAVLEWMRTAQAGDKFHDGIAECVCLG